MKCPWKSSCTCFVDKLFGVSIKECCDAHDYEYEIQVHSKEVVDERLFNCVKRRVGYVVALVMWLGVRVGGYIVSWNKIKKEKKDVKKDK